MIIDRIENAGKYTALHPEFERVFASLKAFSADTEPCTCEVNGEKAFITVSEYTNKPANECAFEAHRQYIDIQYVISGHEQIDICPADGLRLVQDFEDGGDIAFYGTPDSFSSADLPVGFFAVIFPGEAHRPLVAPGGIPQKTKKAVAKLLAV